MARINFVRFAVVLPFLAAFLWMAYGNDLRTTVDVLMFTGVICWPTSLYFLME